MISVARRGTSNKFGAVRTEYGGRTFDSRKEAAYARSLEMLRKASLPRERVVDVQYQVPYEMVVNGVRVCKYILDFKVTYGNERVDHVDVKGYRKGSSYSVFSLKRKLMRALFGIDITEA